MLRIISQIKQIAALLFFLLMLANSCHAEHIKNLNDISTLDFNNNFIKVTAPYSILKETTYTSDLNTMVFKKYLIKIIDTTSPENLILEITKNSSVSLNNKEEAHDKKLPWWSKTAPSILKTLDFSKVDGNLEEYQITSDYRLKLLSKEGAWGLVYVLEHLKKDSRPEKICAVKLLLTKKNKYMNIQEFRKRHIDEINHNFILAERNPDIGVIPQGMLKNDDDHYLIFLALGERARDLLNHQSPESSIPILYDLLINVNDLHLSGITHGDLNVRNMLFFDKKIKFCDWFSLCDFTKNNLNQYRYIGDYLPPEAMRALHFGQDSGLDYSIVTLQGKKQIYLLHPIAADRFCLGMSLLEIIAPDLQKKYDSLNDKDFNPWRPKSLDFWAKHANYIQETQKELLKRASENKNVKIAKLYKQIAYYIDLDPMKRQFILSKND